MEDQKIEESIVDEIKCFDCKKKIHEKPWITLKKKNMYIYGCSWNCSRHLSKYMNEPYHDMIVNKEDFNYHLIPKIKKSKKENLDNEEIIQIKKEIEEENKRIQQIEDDYYDSSSEYTDEEYY